MPKSALQVRRSVGMSQSHQAVVHCLGRCRKVHRPPHLRRACHAPAVARSQPEPGSWCSLGFGHVLLGEVLRCAHGLESRAPRSVQEPVFESSAKPTGAQVTVDLRYYSNRPPRALPSANQGGAHADALAFPAPPVVSEKTETETPSPCPGPGFCSAVITAFSKSVPTSVSV